MPKKKKQHCSKKAHEGDVLQIERPKNLASNTSNSWTSYVLRQLGISETVGYIENGTNTNAPLLDKGLIDPDKLDRIKGESSDRPQQLESELLKTLQSNLDALQNDYAELDQKIRKLNARIAKQDQNITNQDQKIGDLNDRIEKGEMLWGKLFVENVSSQVLLVAAGMQQAKASPHGTDAS